MTLGFTIQHAGYCLIALDRRISGPGILNDDFGKIGHVEFRDARLLFGFTGLAQLGHESMFSKLCEDLCESGEMGNNVLAHLANFRDRLQTRYDLLRGVSRDDKRTTIAFVGFLGSQALPATLMVSNFESLDGADPGGRFYLSRLPSFEPGESRALFIGRHDLVTTADVDGIIDTLATYPHPHAGLEAVVQAIRRISIVDKRETIGMRINTAWIAVDPNIQLQAEYFHDGTSSRFYHPASINARWDEYGAFLMTDAESQGLDDSGVPIISRVAPPGSRHAPCPCGSGKRFKNCHAKQSKSQFGDNATQFKASSYFMVKKHPTREEGVNIMTLMGKAKR